MFKFAYLFHAIQIRFHSIIVALQKLLQIFHIFKKWFSLRESIKVLLFFVRFPEICNFITSLTFQFHIQIEQQVKIL